MSDIIVEVVPVGYRQTDPDEEPIATFPAVCERLVENLDDADECDFTISLDTVAAEELELGTHEVLIYYRSRCWCMRPLASDPDLGDNTMLVHCYGLETWFEERDLYEAIDNNIGHNMDFEIDEDIQNPGSDGWITADYNSNTTAAHLTATVVDTDHMRGSQCAQLVGTSTGIQSVMYQNAATTLRPGIPFADVVGQKLFLSGWYKIVSQAPGSGYQDWKGPPPPGLMIQTHETTDEIYNLSFFAVAPLDPASAPHDEWTRIEISDGLRIRESVTAINWFVASVAGTILWDGIRLTTDPVIIFQGADVTEVIETLTEYAQGTLDPLPYPSIKTDLFIGTDIDTVGVSVSRVFHLYDRTPIWDIFKQYMNRDDGVDIWIDVDCDTGTRTLRVAGMKGSSKPDAFLEPGVTVERSGRATVDARKGTNAMVMTSSFSGPAGEYGWANTLDDDDVVQGWGGNLRERVASAPSDTPIDSLIGLAEGERAINAEPQVVPSITGSAARLLDDPDYDLRTGDVAPYSVAQGWFVRDLDIRIASLQINPRKDTVTIVPLPAQRGSNVEHDTARTVGFIAKRVTALEQAHSVVPYVPPVVKEAVDWGLEEVDTVESPALTVAVGGTLDHALVSLRAASSSGDVEVDVKVNGSVLDTVTVPSGDLSAHSAKLQLAVRPDVSIVTFEITSAGTDAAGLVCSARIY